MTWLRRYSCPYVGGKETTPSTPDGGEWSVSRPKAIRRLLLHRRLGGPPYYVWTLSRTGKRFAPPHSKNWITIPKYKNRTGKTFSKKNRYMNSHTLIKTTVRLRAFIGMTSDTIRCDQQPRHRQCWLLLSVVFSGCLLHSEIILVRAFKEVTIVSF